MKTTIAAIGLCVALAGHTWAQTNQGLVIVGQEIVSAPTNYNNKQFFKSGAEATIDECDKKIALNPNDVDSYEVRAYFKEIKGDLDGALADLSKAIELNPKFGKNYVQRGHVKALKRNFDSALADLNKAIELEAALEPTNNPALSGSPQMYVWQLDNAYDYEIRGYVNKYKGDLTGAQADLKTIELNPKLRESIEAKGYLMSGSNSN
jgi:tetratricopeptide (TPR) repeat protein